MKRTKTPTGEIIRFAGRTVPRGEPPAFASDHPGIIWAQYVAKLTHDNPLADPAAVQPEAWQHPVGNGGQVMGRVFVSCGRKLFDRAAALELIQAEESEDAGES